MERSVLCIDLGGTKLLVGEVDEKGNVLRSLRIPAVNLSRKETMERICQGLDELTKEPLSTHTPCAIGIGMIGRIDSEEGIWYEYSPVSKEPVEVKKILEEKYHLPCFVDNDTRSAARAEWLFGDPEDSKDFIYVNVGTGIAAGMVSGGKILKGGHFNAGEVGHTSSGIDFKAPCFCGREDCVEPVASGMGIDQCVRILKKKYPDSAILIPEEGVRVNAGDVFKLYDTDELCKEVTDNAAKAVANLVMNLVRFCDPDRVVLGGGVVADGFLFEKICSYLGSYTMRYVSKGIMLTKLDPKWIGLLGACSNALLGMEETK